MNNGGEILFSVPVFSVKGHWEALLLCSWGRAEWLLLNIQTVRYYNLVNSNIKLINAKMILMREIREMKLP